jgi:uncharacterized protein
MIYVDRLEWDSQNIEHIAQHNVIPEEVEEVCHDKYISRGTHHKRILLIGPTQSGRMIAIVLRPLKKRGSYRTITARPTSRDEIRQYDEESR